MLVNNFTYDYIKLGNCLDLMCEIPDKSIDMVLCDLPYGVLNKTNKSARWDIPIDLTALWSQYKRILKDNGVVVLFGQGMFSCMLMNSNPEWWRYNLIWDKVRASGFLNAKRQPLRCHEDILVFYLNTPTYNPQMRKCLPNQRNHSRGRQQNDVTNRCYGSIGKVADRITDEKYPRSIISFNRSLSKCVHPTQKPVPLLEYLILTYTNEGDVVLDNCMGSGSTIIAAIRTKRHFIGYELDCDFYDAANKRMKNELKQPFMF